MKEVEGKDKPDFHYDWSELRNLRTINFKKEILRKNGVVAMVNQCTNGSAKGDDVQYCRALFYEHDTISIEESKELWKKLGLPEPTFQVPTGNKSIHSYWVLEEPVSPEEWKPVQIALLEYANADDKLKNPNRMMRLPGWKHNKSGVPASFIKCSGKPYSFQELKAIIPPVSNSVRVEPPKKLEGSDTRLELIGCLKHAHRRLIETGIAEGGRNDTLFKLGCDIFGTATYLESIGQEFHPSARELFEIANNNCNPPVEQGELDKVWESVTEKDRQPGLSPDYIRNCIKRKVVPNSESWEDTNLKTTDRLKLLLEQEYAERLTWNVYKHRVELDESPIDVDSYWLTIVDKLGTHLNKSTIINYLAAHAKRYELNKIENYLLRLEQEIQPPTQDTPAINQLINDILGIPEGIERTYIKKWLIAAVARALEPGCQVDAALILKGKQGIGKTRTFEALAPEGYFNTFTADMSSKDGILELHNNWINEVGEFEHSFSKSDLQRLKAKITQAVDQFRIPYDSNVSTKARRFVLCGSTNEQEFLPDRTGNRRFWVVSINQKIDLERIRTLKDSIWREALFLYRSGTKWHLNDLEIAAANEHTAQFEMVGILDEELDAFLEKKQKLKMPFEMRDILLDLELPNSEWKKVDKMLAAMLRKRGYEVTQRRFNGKKARFWCNEETLWELPKRPNLT
jgi:predicted P-loop ATPase